MRLTSIFIAVVCVTAVASKAKNGSKSTSGEKEASEASSTEGPQNKLLESWLGNVQTDADINDNDRTWRLNRKALVPILVGLGIKSLALVSLSLFALTVIGSIAIGTSKLSLAISAFMFLKRFFSSDSDSGGFFGLNPLKFPQRQENHLPYPQGPGGLNRRLWNIRNPLG